MALTALMAECGPRREGLMGELWACMGIGRRGLGHLWRGGVGRDGACLMGEPCVSGVGYGVRPLTVASDPTSSA